MNVPSMVLVVWRWIASLVTIVVVAACGYLTYEWYDQGFFDARDIGLEQKGAGSFRSRVSNDVGTENINILSIDGGGGVRHYTSKSSRGTYNLSA